MKMESYFNQMMPLDMLAVGITIILSNNSLYEYVCIYVQYVCI